MPTYRQRVRLSPPMIPPAGIMEASDDHRDGNRSARPRGHALRFVRGADREEAERARGRVRNGEPRHRTGDRPVRTAGPGRAARRRRGVDRLRRAAHHRRRPERGPSSPRRTAACLDAEACRRGRPQRPGRTAGHGPAAALRQLGVGRARAVDARRLLLGARLPPRCAEERPPLRGDDGHADLARHARCLAVVDGRPGRGPRHGHVLRGRGRRHDPHRARPIPRGSGEGPFVGGDREAASARRQKRSRASRRARAPRPGRRPASRQPLRRSAGREGRDRRRRRRG
jgi:hypothetical protein